MTRAPGTRVQTTQGPALDGVIVEWCALPRARDTMHAPRDRDAPEFIDPTRPVNPPGAAIVLHTDGSVALCMTGHWHDVYARSVTCHGVDPLDAFARLTLATTLVETLHRAACWDKFEIGARITQLWELEKAQ